MRRGLIVIACSLFSIFAHAWKPGIENLTPQTLHFLQNKRYQSCGLITNQTGKTTNGKRAIDVLLSHKVPLKKILVTEHGLEGKIGAGLRVEHSIDTKTKLPVVSLYRGEEHTIDHALLRDLDLIFVDLQDSGMRHYTYISTLYVTLEAAQALEKAVVILDRPNPLGAVMEGPLVDPSLHSFISIAPIPLRHGLTMGELARYFNEFHFDGKIDLQIVPLQGHKRSIGLGNTWLAPLSPNITSLRSCHGYSFLGVLSEIGPFDVGIGTNKAFQCLLLPESLQIPQKKWICLSLQLKKLHLESLAFRYYHPVKKKWFNGLQFHLPDMNKFSSVQAIIAILDFFKRENISFSFRKIDKAFGTSLLREYVEGKIEKHALVSAMNTQLKSFANNISRILIYEPAPKIITVAT